MRKLNVTDRWMDGGRCNISRPGPLAPREIKKKNASTESTIIIWYIYLSLFLRGKKVYSRPFNFTNLGHSGISRNEWLANINGVAVYYHSYY